MAELSIISFSPSSGFVGDEVTITGAGFGSYTTVKLYDEKPATIKSYTSTEIVFYVPEDSENGCVYVSNDGLEWVISETYFYVKHPISITLFSPTSGHIGDMVTITGTGFDDSVNIFFYNNIPATIESHTDTQIITHVPNLSETGIITVTNDLVSDSSSGSFLVLDRYWIGNSGDWNDISHWSTSSGGPDGAAIPTSASMVIFDENSFTTDSQTVSLSGDCYCKTFNCLSVNKLATFDFAESAYLNVYENITISPNLSFTYPVLTNNDIIDKRFTFGIRIIRSCNITSNGVKLPPILQLYIDETW